MFANSPFAVPRSSFERPVPLVLVDPDESPTVCLQVNREWMPYILGALKQLVLQTTWDTADPDALNLVQARAMTLIAMFQQSLRQPGCDGCCQEYPMSDEIFTWAPQNPFTQPDLVPDGYRFPPWFIAPDTTLIPGIKPGDIVTDLLHAPYNPLANGFPRFRVAVKGAGTVEVKFVRFPTASIALWTVDGSIGSARWTDLHASLEAAIGSFDPEMVIPIEVFGIGDHVVDISIIASISEDPPFVHFGGGIRSVSLCGFIEKQEPKIILIDEMEYQMAICEQLRFQDGKLQALCCGEWADIAGQDGRELGGPGQEGGGSPQPPAGGGCQSYHAVFDAKSQYLVPTVVSTGDTITFTNASGGGSDGTLRWSCPDGSMLFRGDCLGGTTYLDAGDPAPTLNHESLIAQIGSVWYPASSGTITVPGGISNAPITIQMNDSSLADNSGSYALDIEVCNNQAENWISILDFTSSPYDWVRSSANKGIWTPGSGWLVECEQDAGGGGGGAAYMYAQIEGTFASAELTAITMETTGVTLGVFTPTVLNSEIYTNLPAHTNLLLAHATAGTFVMPWSGDASYTNIGLTLMVGYHSEPSGPTPACPGGAGYISKLTISGKGPKPGNLP